MFIVVMFVIEERRKKIHYFPAEMKIPLAPYPL